MSRLRPLLLEAAATVAVATAAIAVLLSHLLADLPTGLVPALVSAGRSAPTE